MVDVNPYVFPSRSPPLFSQMWVSSFVAKFAPSSVHNFFTTRQSELQSLPSANSEVLRGGLKQVPSMLLQLVGHSADRDSICNLAPLRSDSPLKPKIKENRIDAKYILTLLYNFGNSNVMVYKATIPC